LTDSSPAANEAVLFIGHHISTQQLVEQTVIRLDHRL